MANKTIFSAQTANGNSTSFKAIGDINGSANASVIGDSNASSPIYSLLTIYGTFGNATITLQYQAADGNWYSTGIVFFDSCCYFLELNPKVSYRLNLSNATGATSISSTVYDVV